MKSRLLNDSLSFDVSAYYYDYTDKQIVIEVPDPILGNIQNLVNAGAQTSYGLEVSAHWLPMENLSIQAGYAYTNAEFDEFFDPGSGLDFAGNTPPFSPEHSFNMIATYTHQLGDLGLLTIQGDGVFTDKIFFQEDNDPQLIGDSKWVMGGYIGLTTRDEKWDFRLWVKNLTDKEYGLGGFAFSFIGGPFQYVAPPRQVGGSVSYRF